jgi:spore maturation protein CgeB
VYGAGDLETGWNSFSLTSSIVNGYNSTSTISYFDFGDDAPGNWSYYQSWYIAYGARDNLPLPEIYYDADATYDWQILNQWACNTMGGPMYIRGAMSTFIGNTSAQAWTAMYNATASNACTARTLPWYTFSTYMS